MKVKMQETGDKKMKSGALAKKIVVGKREWTLGFVYRGSEQQKVLKAGGMEVKEMTKGWRKAWRAPTVFRRYPNPGWGGWGSESERRRYDAEVKEEPVGEEAPRHTRELQQQYRAHFPSPLEGPMRFAQKVREKKGRKYRPKDWPRSNPKATGSIRGHRWLGNGRLPERQLELLHYDESTGKQRWKTYSACGSAEVDEFFDGMRQEAESRKKGKLKLCCSLCLSPRCGICGAGECLPEDKRVDNRRRGMKCRYRRCLSRLKKDGEWDEYAVPTAVITVEEDEEAEETEEEEEEDEETDMEEDEEEEMEEDEGEEVGDDESAMESDEGEERENVWAVEEGYVSGMSRGPEEGEDEWEEMREKVTVPVDPYYIARTGVAPEEYDDGEEEEEEIMPAPKREKEEETDEVEIIGCGIKKEEPEYKPERNDEWRLGPGNEPVCLGLCCPRGERSSTPGCTDRVPARMVDFEYRCSLRGCEYGGWNTSGAHYRHLRKHYGKTRADALMKTGLENYVMGVEWKTGIQCVVDEQCWWRGGHQMEGWAHLKRHHAAIEKRWGGGAPVVTAMQRLALELWQRHGCGSVRLVVGPEITVALSWVAGAEEDHVGWVEVEKGESLERGREVEGATERWLEINKGGVREGRRMRVTSLTWEGDVA